MFHALAAGAVLASGTVVASGAGEGAALAGGVTSVTSESTGFAGSGKAAGITEIFMPGTLPSQRRSCNPTATTYCEPEADCPAAKLASRTIPMSTIALRMDAP